MAEKKAFNLKVITPGGVKVEERAEMVIMRATTGDMGVLPGHEPCSAALDQGILRITAAGGRQRRLGVFGGLAKVEGDTLTVLTGLAQWPSEVEPELAQAERDECLVRLREERDHAHTQRDKELLNQALVRIELSEFRDEA
ncbi:MAG: ATP synthase F1 subunit epsilon [Oscillospiraceae bacterium]|nr:ATP synthase F1 subunit epsilon [Oscillospiraceae bacterium]